MCFRWRSRFPGTSSVFLFNLCSNRLLSSCIPVCLTNFFPFSVLLSSLCNAGIQSCCFLNAAGAFFTEVSLLLGSKKCIRTVPFHQQRHHSLVQLKLCLVFIATPFTLSLLQLYNFLLFYLFLRSVSSTISYNVKFCLVAGFNYFMLSLCLRQPESLEA